MHATIRIYAASGDLVDRLVANESAIRDLLTGIDGFRMYHLLRTADGTVSISIFDTEEGTAESTRVAADWVRAFDATAGGESRRRHRIDVRRCVRHCCSRSQHGQYAGEIECFGIARGSSHCGPSRSSVKGCNARRTGIQDHE